MPSIGTLTVSTFRTQADQTDYALAGNTVSVTNLVALRRQLPVQKGEDKGVLRANMRLEKTFPVGDSTKQVVFNLSGIIPVGVDTAAVEAYIDETLLEAAESAAFKALMVSGDINVSD
jgi:hypothetical protein